MKSPTVILFYFFLASVLTLSAGPASAFQNSAFSPTPEIKELRGKSLRQILCAQLRADQLITGEAQHVKIEFEFHDIFVNERILPYELIAKYQKIFTNYGIQAGPQRQIHLYSNGDVLIGDFGQYGELIKETPVEELSEI